MHSTINKNKHKMRGRQINFFVMPDEWGALEDYLKENDMISVARTMDTQELELSNISEKELSKYLVENKYKETVKVYPIEKINKYSMSELYSPIIQFSRSYYDKEKNLLRRGRFYYKKGFWNDNDEWEEKPTDFVKKGERLFRWFKKNYKDAKIPEWKGFLVTQKVKDKVENEGLELTQI